MKRYKRPWTQGEKWLFAAPLLVAVAACSFVIAPQTVGHLLGWPMVLPTSPNNILYRIALSSDGRTLAAGGNIFGGSAISATIYLWDARSLRPLPPLPPHQTRNYRGDTIGNFLGALAVSPDGSIVAANRGTTNLEVIDVKSQRVLWTAPSDWFSSMEFSPDGRVLGVTSSRGKGENYSFFNTRNGKLLRTWKVDNLASGQTDLDFSNDGGMVAYISGQSGGSQISPLARILGGRIEIRRLSDGARITNFNEETVSSVHFAPDGRSLLVVDDVDPEDRIASFVSTGSIVKSVSLSGQKRWQYPMVDSTGRTLRGHFITGAIISPDGKSVAVYEHGNIVLLDASTGQELRQMSCRGETSNATNPSVLGFSPDGKRLFARGRNSVLVWDLDS